MAQMKPVRVVIQEEQINSFGISVAYRAYTEDRHPLYIGSQDLEGCKETVRWHFAPRQVVFLEKFAAKKG